MDQRIRINVADDVFMRESRCGSTNLIFMYRGRCRRLCSLRRFDVARATHSTAGAAAALARQVLPCTMDASVSEVIRTNVSARMLFTKVYNNDTEKTVIAGGLCFIHTPPRHAFMNMHQLVPSYTTSGRQQHGSDVLASDHTRLPPPSSPLSLFAPVLEYCGLSAAIHVFDSFHRLMYTGGTCVPDTT